MKKIKNCSKGVLVFTHKEKFIFESENLYIQQLIERLKQSYIIGMHWGHYHKEVNFKTNIDFHLAGKGTVKFPSNVYALSLCSRNFIPSFFTPGIEKKKWDILMVARPIKDKNIDSFFRVVKKLYKLHPSLKVLLIAPMPYPGWPQGNFYQDIIKDYDSLFNDQEKNNFLFLPVAYGNSAFPISAKNLAFFYQQSKIFTLFSSKEGESRVIAEALLCGLPVVARRDLIGGGLDYLNETNSCLFLTEDEAVRAFDDLLQRPLKFDADYYAHELRADFTEKKFTEEIKKIFMHLDLPFEGELITSELDRRLPNHHWPNSLEGLDMETINDLPNLKTFIKFSRFLLGKREGLDKNPIIFYVNEIKNKIIRFKEIFIKFIKKNI